MFVRGMAAHRMVDVTIGAMNGGMIAVTTGGTTAATIAAMTAEVNRRFRPGRRCWLGEGRRPW